MLPPLPQTPRFNVQPHPNQAICAHPDNPSLPITLLRALTTEFSGPFFAAPDIFLRHSWPRALDGFDEVLEEERRLEESVAVDFCPGHLDCALVARGAGGKFFNAIDIDLVLLEPT